MTFFVAFYAVSSAVLFILTGVLLRSDRGFEALLMFTFALAADILGYFIAIDMTVRTALETLAVTG